MVEEDEPASITYGAIQNHLQSYPSYVPPSLHPLDKLRFQEIPGKLAERKESGDAFLEKSEVSALVEWKLKHGTYRPKLASLVASNDDEHIRSITKSAFAKYGSDNHAFLKSIKTLSALKGIGPATASLLLSCYDPIKVPFFSDELFRYALWKRTSGEGWDRKIKYSTIEYAEMFKEVKALRKRLEEESGETVSAVDLEKVAYVLGKEAEPKSKRFVGDGGRGEQEQVAQPGKSSRKRKGATNEGANTENEARVQPEKPTKKRKSKTSDAANAKDQAPPQLQDPSKIPKGSPNEGGTDQEQKEAVQPQKPTQKRKDAPDADGNVNNEAVAKTKKKRRR